MSEDARLDELGDNMRAFEAALEAGAARLADIGPERALAAGDGSNQTDTLCTVVAELLRALPSLTSLALIGEGFSLLEEAPPAVRIEAMKPRLLLEPERAHEQILTAARETHADLVVLPIPFLGDFDDLGDDSLGTTGDVLLERMHLPLLAVRDPSRRGVLQRTVLFVEDSSPAALRAAAWAAAVAGEGLRVVVAASEAERRAWSHLAGRRFAPDDDAVREALSLGTAPLVAAIHRASVARDREARVRVAVESLETVVAEKNAQPSLHVVPVGPLSRAVCLHSANPVLMVP